MGKLDSKDDKLMTSQRELEKLEDDYHHKIMVISDKFFELEVKRSEFKMMLQDTYEATSHNLRQDDVLNEEAFMTMNHIIDSFQSDFDTEYAKEHSRLTALEEATNQEYYKKRQVLESKIDQLMSERRDNGNC
ncbi:hypothetical protein N1495_01400 [Streptococcus didelphis]|uniref:Cingulin n=1 Tax=Streptococcus didelphis TaxID=102886 RepID=A0ABY9LFY6_9STRE|nr:hypothetical protein [Streptococcus didelphis]WMB27837.1 hypothetical protein N1496_07210 [Streptococcus didelphis]WMB29701.1 hypothetical protein N1495_01400 [Streptococcus didelphis]